MQQIVNHIIDAVTKRIAEIESDSRYPHSPDQEANVFANAPLALIQMGMKGQVSAFEESIRIINSGGN